MGFYQNKSVKCNDAGQGILELALVLPILVLIIFGVLDLGRVFFATITLTNAAREGVRYLTLHPDDISVGFSGSTAAAVQEANFYDLSITGNEVDVTCRNTDDDDDFCDRGFPASVTVEYDFDLILGWLFPTIRLSRSAVMVIP